MPTTAATTRLAELLKEIDDPNGLPIYGESSYRIREVNVGSGQTLEIHYYDDSLPEIQEAFFIFHGTRVQLSDDEVAVLRVQF